MTSKKDEIGCQLLLITNRKSHTGFRLVVISVILNDLERRNSPYFALFHRIRYLVRPITSQWLKIEQQCPQNIFSLLLLARTDPHSSRTVSLRQFSFLYLIAVI